MSMKPRQDKAVIRRNRTIRTIIILVVVAALLVFAVFYGRNRVRTMFASSSSAEVLSAQASTGSIIATVSGSGTLQSDDIESVTIPSSVNVGTVYVKIGDVVEAGDALASVDSDSVLSALADMQSQLDSLDAQLEAASEDSVGSTITAGVAGRVKMIYGEAGQDVSSIMYDHGALMLLSLDGHMAIDIEAEGYAVGDEVTVTASDGTSYTGTVSAISQGTVTVLVTDDGPIYGDTVTVDDRYTGALYIHEPLKVTGYAGTISEVNVSENSSVSTSDTLLTLTDTSYSANYNQILAERQDLEATFQTLIQIYKDGIIYAPVSGSIESVPSSGGAGDTSIGSGSNVASSMGGGGAGSAETTVFTINPNETMSVSISVDETDILSVELGQDVSVTISSIGDDTYSGSVTDIDTTAASAGGVSTYTVTATIERVSDMMEGMTATVNITIEGVEDALIVPADAVQYTSSTSYVYTTYDESTGDMGGMVEVTAGLSNGTDIEIIEGLSEGDTVYYTEKDSGDDLMSLISSMMGGGMGGMGGGGMGGPGGY